MIGVFVFNACSNFVYLVFQAISAISSSKYNLNNAISFDNSLNVKFPNYLDVGTAHFLVTQSYSNALFGVVITNGPVQGVRSATTEAALYVSPTVT